MTTAQKQRVALMHQKNDVADTEIKPVYSQTSEMTIGKTTYIVTTYYKKGGCENVEQKLLRYVSGYIAAELKGSENIEK